MANVKKYTRSAVGHLFAHFERRQDEEGNYVKFGNQSIDPERSHLNYNLAPERGSQEDYLHKRLSEVHCLKRADVNVMCSWVVTAPKDLPPGSEDAFFRETYNFLCNRYGGEDNVISSYVHMDEASEHMHHAFIPVVYDKKKDRYKVSAKEVVNQSDLKAFHKDLEKYLEHSLGFHVNVLNEATKDGNKEVLELKKETLKKEIEQLEIELDDIKNIKNNIDWIDNIEVVEKGWKNKTVSMAAELWQRVKVAYKQVFINALQFDKLQKKVDSLEHKVNTYEKSFPDLIERHRQANNKARRLEQENNKYKAYIGSRGLESDYRTYTQGLDKATKDIGLER